MDVLCFANHTRNTIQSFTCPSNGINGGASSINTFFPTAPFSDLTGTFFWGDCLEGGDFLADFFRGDLEDEDWEVMVRGEER